MGDVLIAITNLVKRFTRAGQDSLTAVNRVSLHVSAGEIYGLLGPNGAGKTTTLRMLSTLMKPDEGTLLIHGVDAIKRPQDARTHLAYVPAEAGLPDKLSPVEVVTLYAALQGVDNPKQRALDSLARLGAQTYQDQPCGDLSTGMKRRVVLARALVHDPSVLLLDEPTDGLDVSGRREVLALVREIAGTGRAIIISSHIMSEVEKVADRVGVVSAGVLVAEGTIDEILAQSGKTTLDDAFIALTSEKE
jgi:ABC-type multidrug transport system ATPase subunit